MQWVIAAEYDSTSEEVNLELCSIDHCGHLDIVEFLGNRYVLHLPGLAILQNEHRQLIALAAALKYFHAQHINVVEGENGLHFSTAAVNVLASELGVEYVDLVRYGEDDELAGQHGGCCHVVTRVLEQLIDSHTLLTQLVDLFACYLEFAVEEEEFTF